MKIETVADEFVGRRAIVRLLDDHGNHLLSATWNDDSGHYTIVASCVWQDRLTLVEVHSIETLKKIGKWLDSHMQDTGH